MVGAAVVVGGLYGCWVDVHSVDISCTKLGGTNGQNARAATIVQRAPQRTLGLARNPAQAHTGCGVGAGTKGQTRVQTNADLGLLRQFMPGGNNPELGRDVHGLKLRLRQSHPVLLGHRLDGQNFAAFKEVLWLQQFTRFNSGSFIREQRNHTAALPAVLGRRHAWLAKQGLLSVGLRIRIFNRYAQCIECIQRIAHGFNPVFGAQQAQLEHGQSFLKPAPNP